jgi:hypothetical protein
MRPTHFQDIALVETMAVLTAQARPQPRPGEQSSSVGCQRCSLRGVAAVSAVGRVGGLPQSRTVYGCTDGQRPRPRASWLRASPVTHGTPHRAQRTRATKLIQVRPMLPDAPKDPPGCWATRWVVTAGAVGDSERGDAGACCGRSGDRMVAILFMLGSLAETLTR